MCNHDRLRTVGDRVFCCKCNEELSIEFLMGKNGEKGRLRRKHDDQGISQTDV